MRLATASLLALTLGGTGCLIVPVRHAPRTSASRSSTAGKKCPPGHVWSDGECHSKGKGHDK